MYPAHVNLSGRLYSCERAKDDCLNLSKWCISNRPLSYLLSCVRPDERKAGQRGCRILKPHPVGAVAKQVLGGFLFVEHVRDRKQINSRGTRAPILLKQDLPGRDNCMPYTRSRRKFVASFTKEATEGVLDSPCSR